MQSTQLHHVPGHGRGVGPSRSADRMRRRRESWERANRLGLLLVHGLIGLFAGLLILFTGSAQAFDDFGAWVRPVTGGLAMAGGALLVIGLARRPRPLGPVGRLGPVGPVGAGRSMGAGGSMGLEVGGLVLMAGWDLTMVGGFVASAAREGELAVVWPWQEAVLPAARLYPIALYVGLFLMMCVHLWTMRRLDASELPGNR